MFLSGVKDDTLFKKPREIVHKNTRFNGDPFSKTLNKSQIQQAAALNAQVSTSKMSSILNELCTWLLLFKKTMLIL